MHEKETSSSESALTACLVSMKSQLNKFDKNPRCSFPHWKRLSRTSTRITTMTLSPRWKAKKFPHSRCRSRLTRTHACFETCKATWLVSWQLYPVSSLQQAEPTSRLLASHGNAQTVAMSYSKRSSLASEAHMHPDSARKPRIRELTSKCARLTLIAFKLKNAHSWISRHLNFKRRLS